MREPLAGAYTAQQMMDLRESLRMDARVVPMDECANLAARTARVHLSPLIDGIDAGEVLSRRHVSKTSYKHDSLVGDARKQVDSLSGGDQAW